MTKTDRRDSISTMHRENIINAGDALFTEKGFEKTTMDEISAMAQYSKRTIYTYFESKDEIYSHFVVKGAKILAENFENAINSSDNFIECYQEICHVISRFHDEQYPYYEGVMRYINGLKESNPSPAVAEIYAIADMINEGFELFFKEGQNQGIILQNVDIKKIVLVIWSNIISFIELTTKKADYIEDTLNATRIEFSNFGFNLILNSVLDVG